MKIPQSAYRWALKHLVQEGDSDLFPRLFEVDAFKYSWPAIRDNLANMDIRKYRWRGGRRFVIPKGVHVFRKAVQLDALDSWVLAAIIKQYGRKMEIRRSSIGKNRVFSYRFAPTNDGLFYSDTSSWTAFWEHSLVRTLEPGCNWVAVTDVTDYYNQIYHHVLENELAETGIPAAIVRSIMELLSTVSSGVSRGIPVGPHAAHLLAECAFTPTDRSLLTHGYDYCRYVDDFADVLDKQQKLTLQRHKTKVLPAEEFRCLARSMTVDNVMNDEEAEIIAIIQGHSGDNPYRLVALGGLSQEELEAMEPDKLIRLLQLYLNQDPVAYSRIGWLLRRLSQVGAPGAIDFVLEHFRS
jgi:hypothetical protein